MNLNLDDIVEAVERDENKGFCLACGCEHDGIEPDAEKYKCQQCGQMKVYGAEQILLCFA